MEKGLKPAGPPGHPNQRCNLRVPLIVEKLPCGDGRKTFFGYARNISCSGLFIATVNPRQPGDQFDLQMSLPPSAGLVLRCRCEVVWRRLFEQGRKNEPGMGLRFLDLSADAAEELAAWLQNLAKISAP
jgi:hypothetical protein